MVARGVGGKSGFDPRTVHFKTCLGVQLHYHYHVTINLVSNSGRSR